MVRNRRPQSSSFWLDGRLTRSNSVPSGLPVTQTESGPPLVVVTGIALVSSNILEGLGLIQTGALRSVLGPRLRRG